MMIFLVIISIAFNMIAFLLIAILFLRQNKLIKMEESLKQPVKEMEDLMTTYLLQMKEENEQFIKWQPLNIFVLSSYSSSLSSLS